MKSYSDLLDNLNRFDLDDVFFELWSDVNIQNFIIELNTEGKPSSQLIRGIDNEGNLIEPPYTFNTIQYKVNKGQIFDVVTLRDTRDFYESFVVIPLKTGYRIESDPIKEGKSLFDKYGDDIEGLTGENIEIKLAFIEEGFNRKLEQRLFR